MELQDRVRKIDINKMSKEQVDELSAQIGEKIRKICDDAVNEANRILAVYGMVAKMAIQISNKNEDLDNKKNKKRPSSKKKTSKT